MKDIIALHVQMFNLCSNFGITTHVVGVMACSNLLENQLITIRETNERLLAKNGIYFIPPLPNLDPVSFIPSLSTGPGTTQWCQDTIDSMINNIVKHLNRCAWMQSC